MLYYKDWALVIPMANEEADFKPFIEMIDLVINELNPGNVYFVVDNASKDRTLELCQEQSKKDSRYVTVWAPENKNVVDAYIRGLRTAYEAGHELIIEMDADGSHRPEDLVNLIKISRANPSLDLIIGSRWVKGGAVRNWAKSRELLSRAANKYAKLMLHVGVNDVTAGFRVYKTSIIERIDFSTVLSQGYCFQIEMTRKVLSLKGKIKEVPITFIEREFGVSKMNTKIVIEAMVRVTLWGLRITK